MIYFDNAATSFPKPESVKREIIKCLDEYSGNPGRSSHRLSLAAAEKIYSARETVSEFIGARKPECVVFTYNATHALNLAIKSITPDNCHVLTSDFEHNAVIRPLERLKRDKGISYTNFSIEGDLKANLNKLKRSDTKGIITSIASNVTGDEIPLKLVSDYAKDNGLFLIIDASQAIGHIKIDLSNCPCDALCAPAHKALYGIQGCGFVYFCDNRRREGLIEGGSGYDSANPYMPEFLPEGYEAGTPSTPAIATLEAGIKYIQSVGDEQIKAKLAELTSRAEEQLASLPSLKLYKSGIGILSFNIGDIPSSFVASRLDKMDICVRGGLHCAPSIHKRLGTLGQGAIRLSFSLFNTASEVDRIYTAIKEIISEI